MPKYQLTEKQKNLLCTLVPSLQSGQTKKNWLIYSDRGSIRAIDGLEDEDTTRNLWNTGWKEISHADFDDFIEQGLFRCVRYDRTNSCSNFTLYEQRIIDACENDFELPAQNPPLAQNTYNIHQQSGIVNLQSTLKDVRQTINNAPTLNDDFKQQLEQLMSQLNTQLDSVPEENYEDAETVAINASRLADDISREKPNKTSISISAEGLIKAAQNLSKLVPAVATTATAIVDLIRANFPMS